ARCQPVAPAGPAGDRATVTSRGERWDLRLRRRSAPELTQDVLEDAAVAVVLDLVGGVDPDPAGQLPVVGAHGDLTGEAVGAGALQPGDGEGLVPGEARRVDRPLAG